MVVNYCQERKDLFYYVKCYSDMSPMLAPVLLVLLAPGEAGEAACSAQQMQGAWLASLSTACRPRPTLLSLGDLVTPAPGHTLAHPTHVEVDRCAGSCSQGQSINDLTLRVISFQQ